MTEKENQTNTQEDIRMKSTESIISVETIPVKQAAKIMGISPDRLPEMILNGTLPIGGVSPGNKMAGKKTITVIFKNRLEAYLQARDLER